MHNNSLSELSTIDFEKYIISITTDSYYNVTPEYANAFLAVDFVDNKHKPNTTQMSGKNASMNHQPQENKLSSVQKPTASVDDELSDSDFFSNLYGFIFKDEEPSIAVTTTPATITSTIPPNIRRKNVTAPPSYIQNNTIPLKLITILNNTKKDSPTKIEIPQRKNNKIINPTDEPLYEDTYAPTTTELPLPLPKNLTDKVDNLTILRDVLLATLNHQSINGDASDKLIPNSPIYLQRPINKLRPSLIGSGNFPGLTPSNSIESKHNYQKNPIHSELDLMIPQQNEFSHNNFSPDNYQVLPANSDITNTESYVINPVDLNKLNAHHSDGETKIFTPPLKDSAGVLKVAGCNIYGQMYRVGRIISELSGPCLECRCTEVGVSCTPLDC